MPSSDLSTTIILSEIIVVETVAIIGISVYFFLKAKNKAKKLDGFLKSFINDESKRLSTLTNNTENLKELNGVDNVKYDQSLKNIIKEENTFYKYIINIIYSNKLNLLESFQDEIQKINKPLSGILTEDSSEAGETGDDTPEINIDDAIDDLLSDDPAESEIENDPAFDLSDSPELDAEIKTEENIEADAIAEIPSELLNTVNSPEPEKASENIVEDKGLNSTENKPEK